MMPRFRFLLASLVSLSAIAQQPAPSPPQTARQALIEIITGGEKALQKHLTVEVQQALTKNGGGPAAAMLKGLGSAGFGARPGMQVFETGPVLLALNEPAEHKKMEVHVESDDLSGEEDILDLSFHTYADGQEQSEPFQFVSHFAVGMKRQQGIWRINTISVQTDFPVGDADFLDKLFGPATATGTGFSGVRVSGPPLRSETPEPAAPDPGIVIEMLAIAEGNYAIEHPETGFTCSWTDLLDASKATFSSLTVDPDLARGRANGYKFAITGCEGKPAGSFQISAEPLVITPGTKALCTDATRNVRFSEDGRSSTCISSGKPQRVTPEKVVTPEVQMDFKPEH
jgi:hypothetical protein